jgi:UDP-N-acetylmuramoyl-L-alanyl-D-glutamate--2,6-diaminopimelate ligase
MVKEGILDKILFNVKKLIPRSVFNFFQPVYHTLLAYAGAFVYGFPSKKMKVIGITGTKGKSTVTYLVSRILEANGDGVAAAGSLGYKIKDKVWPNTLKMTMPGRFRLQKLMSEAVKAGCKYFVLEVTSEGIKQKRHLGIDFDCAVFTNLHKEHIESHGSFEKYYEAKQELFRRADKVHVINADDPNFELFSKFHSKKTIFYGLRNGDIIARQIKLTSGGASFEVYGTVFDTSLAGEFNISNCLAALSVGVMYGLDLPSMKPILESVKNIPGRMEFIKKEPFNIVVDYAHTPESLEAVYKTLKNDQKLICVLGAAGGGRDKWKRPEFGKIAGKYCDEIILTNEDPYDENPEKIIEDIRPGIISTIQPGSKVQIIIDRKEAIKTALSLAQKGDVVVITGKGSETSMAVAGNKKVPWSDGEIVRELSN